MYVVKTIHVQIYEQVFLQTAHSGYVTLFYFNHCHHTKSRDDSQTMWQKQSEHIGQWGGIGRVVPIVKC